MEYPALKLFYLGNIQYTEALKDELINGTEFLKIEHSALKSFYLGNIQCAKALKLFFLHKYEPLK